MEENISEDTLNSILWTITATIGLPTAPLQRCRAPLKILIKVCADLRLLITAFGLHWPFKIVWVMPSCLITLRLCCFIPLWMALPALHEKAYAFILCSSYNMDMKMLGRFEHTTYFVPRLYNNFSRLCTGAAFEF